MRQWLLWHCNNNILNDNTLDDTLYKCYVGICYISVGTLLTQEDGYDVGNQME